MTAPSIDLFRPIALGRIAMLRLLAAIFIPIDLYYTTTWVHQHGDVSARLFKPVALARLLAMPAPTPDSVDLIRIALTVLSVAMVVAVVFAKGLPERIIGGLLAALYLWWMLIAMSYGKVDHDRFGFLVLLAVLPTVGAARIGDLTESESAGWAVRVVNIACVATYFLAAVSKVRFGGWAWVNGATFTRAIMRRGTQWSNWTLDYPWLLRVSQWVMLIGEFLSPVLLFVKRQWILTTVVIGLYAFHLMTFMALGIVFLPHLVALASFLPLERIRIPSRRPATAGEVALNPS